MCWVLVPVFPEDFLECAKAEAHERDRSTPRKWLAKRRRRSHDTRQEMFIWGSGIVVFLALFSLLIWVTGRK
jgi:hypothetical protein